MWDTPSVLDKLTDNLWSTAMQSKYLDFHNHKTWKQSYNASIKCYMKSRIEYLSEPRQSHVNNDSRLIIYNESGVFYKSRMDLMSYNSYKHK